MVHYGNYMKFFYRLLIGIFLLSGVAAVPVVAEDLTYLPNSDYRDQVIVQTPSVLYAQNDKTMSSEIDDDDGEDLDYLDEEEDLDEIADPFEPLNRVSFYFNDKLYLWVFEPVARGYSKIVFEEARISVRNVFQNIGTPIRLVNNLLQFKIKSAGNELLRFGFNTTFGIFGLFDFAKDNLGIKMQDEDLGQTLGVWGAGPAFYINWPLLGPSSLRDTIGNAGDHFLDPLSLINPTIDRIAIKTGDQINSMSLRLGDYEEIKKDAIDPYAAFRDIYHQYRNSKIDR